MKKDIEIICSDCKSHFTFTVGEQNFMENLYRNGQIKGLVNPKRCVPCRNKRKGRLDKDTH